MKQSVGAVVLFVLASIVLWSRQAPPYLLVLALAGLVAASSFITSRLQFLPPAVIALAVLQAAMNLHELEPLWPPLIDMRFTLVALIAALVIAAVPVESVISNRVHTGVSIAATAAFIHPLTDTYEFVIAPLQFLQFIVIAVMAGAVFAYRRFLRGSFYRWAAVLEPFAVVTIAWAVAIVFLKSRSNALSWLVQDFWILCAAPSSLLVAVKLGADRFASSR